MNNNFARIIKLVFSFFPKWRLYGFSVAFWSLIFPFQKILVSLKPFFGKRKHSAILNYLINRYGKIINKHLNCKQDKYSFIKQNSPVWVCWWDGPEAMPPVVKICYDSIIHNAGDHPVNFITKNNFKDFVSIPEYIIEKLNSKIITITSFSDILRAVLLFEYGGIWMDITIYVMNNPSFTDYPFFTLKAPARTASITLYDYSGLANHMINFCDDKNRQISRWSSFLLAGTEKSPFFEYIRDFYYAYWQDHNNQIDYMLVDYIIAIGYDYIPLIRALIDNVPCSNAEKFELEKDLNNEYNENNFSQYRNTPFHKLTWKKDFLPYIKRNKLTNYGYLAGYMNK
ncbi:MAG: capsular polysaccharide synthesis protein [Treponema sp.]|jgi:hypothetical protein|nr:capsular polysaccharide synthesis protein [Treponema sp.]